MDAGIVIFVIFFDRQELILRGRGVCIEGRDADRILFNILLRNRECDGYVCQVGVQPDGLKPDVAGHVGVRVVEYTIRMLGLRLLISVKKIDVQCAGGGAGQGRICIFGDAVCGLRIITGGEAGGSVGMLLHAAGQDPRAIALRRVDMVRTLVGAGQRRFAGRCFKAGVCVMVGRDLELSADPCAGRIEAVFRVLMDAAFGSAADEDRLGGIQGFGSGVGFGGLFGRLRVGRCIGLGFGVIGEAGSGDGLLRRGIAARGVVMRLDLRQRTAQNAAFVIAGVVVRMKKEIGIAAEKAAGAVIAVFRMVMDGFRSGAGEHAAFCGGELCIAVCGVGMLGKSAVRLLRDRGADEHARGAGGDEYGKTCDERKQTVLLPAGCETILDLL